MAKHTPNRLLVRLTPLGGRTVADLLKVPMSLDVWERHADSLVAAVSVPALLELERRRLARVERIGRTGDLERSALAGTQAGSGEGS